MEFFKTIYDFYNESKFMDLKIVSGLDGQEIRAHSIVIASAIPGLSEVLSEHYNDKWDEEPTLLFPESSGPDLKTVVTEIYTSLVEEAEIGLEKISFWSNIFCTSGISTKPSSRVSKRTIIRKRRYPDSEASEFEAPGYSKYVKRSRAVKKAKIVNIKDENHCYTPVPLETEQVFETLNEPENTIDDESEDEDQTKKIFYSAKKKLEQDSSDDLSDLMRLETTDLEELSGTEEGEEFPDSIIRPQFNTEPFREGEKIFENLSDLTEAICDENLDTLETHISAFSNGVYLRQGFKPYLPLKGDDTRVENDRDIPIVPKAAFVGIFAIGLREGQNVARPLAILDDSYSTDKVCQNLIPVIRHLTGSSVRNIVECHRHKSFKNLGDKNENVKRFEDKFLDLKSEDLDVIIAENQKYQEKQDEVVQKLKPCSLPENEPVLKFRLINFLSTESVLDYALVYGDDIDALSIQSFIKVSESKLTSVALTTILVDTMAAFCRLKSATSLYNVPFFKDSIDTNFDRMCEKIALNVVRQETKTITRRGKRRTASCPECNTSFPVGNSGDRKKYEAHKMIHVGCSCNITFTTDGQYRAHMKSVHLQKKPFKCPEAQCNSHFFTQAAADKHVNMRHKKAVQNGTGIMCDTCGKILRNQVYLYSHNYCHHNEMTCEICGMVLLGHNSMERHRLKNHATFQDFLCSQCGQGFKARAYLRHHILMSHTQPSDRPFPCKMCEKGFYSSIKLTQHMNGVHLKIKPYKCREETCQSAFASYNERKRHEKRQHNLVIKLRQGFKGSSIVEEEDKNAEFP